MQAITPVDIHVENDLYKQSNVRHDLRLLNRSDQPRVHIRSRALNKTKAKKSKTLLSPSSHIPKQVVVPKSVEPIRSPSPSPSREPWVPPPGRSTKGQKVCRQNMRARLEINPVTEIIIDDGASWNSEHEKHNLTIDSDINLPSPRNEKVFEEIRTYEQRIKGLIDGVAMLKDRIRDHANPVKTDQLRSDINSSLLELEEINKSCIEQLSNLRPKTYRSRSLSPIRNSQRSLSLDEHERRQTKAPRVTFQDDPVIERRRTQSATPVRGDIHLNPDREQLLASLADSEVDVEQITKTLCLVTDILSKLKLEDRSAVSEVEQLYQHRNELLRLIEQFEHSNSILKAFLRHQYHLEAEHGIVFDKYDTLITRIHELEHENEDIRRLLLERENDNVSLQAELERIKLESIGFDTMKASLEQNRAHLQRELYSREGEIHRLQCALRSLERDLQRSRCQCKDIHRFAKHKPVCYIPPSPPPHDITTKTTKAVTIETLQNELDDRDEQIRELKKKLNDSNSDLNLDDSSLEIIRLRKELEQAQQLAEDYKAQLHTQTLKTSANHSKNHLSELELEKSQRRIEELEPLPDQLRQVKAEKEKLQKDNEGLKRRLLHQSNLPAPTPSSDRSRYSHLSLDDDIHTLQLKISSLEDDNKKLKQALRNAEEKQREAESLLNNKASGFIPIAKPYDITKPDFKYADDFSNNKFHTPQRDKHELEQQISKLRFENEQRKREKDEMEKYLKSEINDLRDRLEKSNEVNRAMKNHVHSIKAAHATLFNDTIEACWPKYTTT